ncbi:unnamed protein product [Caenorhabditis nigoni]
MERGFLSQRTVYKRVNWRVSGGSQEAEEVDRSTLVFNDVLTKPRRYEFLPKPPPTVARCRIRPTKPIKSVNCVIC